MARRRVNTTKLEIIQTATRMFLEKGYSATPVKAIADRLEMSTGHLTFYFPTKEHLLAELTGMFCDFQWTAMKQYAKEGQSLLLAICLELTSVAAICEENKIAKDLYLSAYTHPMTLEIIRRNDAQKAQMVFGEYCPDWTEEHFAVTEALVSGIEYATLMTTGDPVSFDMRITGALNNIMLLFQVPEDIRRKMIQNVLAMDYTAIGYAVLQKFIVYIEETTGHAFEELLGRK
ncbi:MAG: helix-turn-helix transcriptional regulator [Lachnospiraceae bacterium]|nr:helix-turn-helix transcriptional regulator [Lachnospiraceae bacterium]